jgi:hypothetical protein
MDDAVVSGSAAKSDWSKARAACCWIGGSVLFLGGLTTAASPASWPNDVVRGVVGMLISPIFIPPLLRRLRERLPVLRPVWAPFFLWIAAGPIATVAGLPFLPSDARQEQFKVEAVADANRLLVAGKPFEARMRLNKFSRLQQSDPVIAAVFAKIAAAERARKSVAEPDTPAKASAKQAPKEVPQSAASIYAERVETYWLPEVAALPDIAPANDDAIGKLLTQIDGLVLNIEDGEKLNLDPAQKAARQKLIRALSLKQVKLLPQLRKRYAQALDAGLFRDDIRVSARGTTLTLTGGVFARNANVQDMQTGLEPVLARLRFRKIDYRWSQYLADGLYYDLKSPADSVVARWDGSQFGKPMN